MTLCLLAHRIEQLTEQIEDLERRLTQLVERHAPQLLTVVGIGPDTAVTLLITVGDNPERLHSEASFAALCGVSPVERSSGSRQYRRLNRGGDRQANAALHRIVQTRLRFDPRTQDYFERRVKEGKTRREIVRCLKRYAAREVFHLVRAVQACSPHRGSEEPPSACRRGFLRSGTGPVGRLFPTPADLIWSPAPGKTAVICAERSRPTGRMSRGQIDHESDRVDLHHRPAADP
ncbi:transposase [Streptomyces inhibens]|uniref:transposase n=1 Tax=Streptomyces inhibens TaxID=2293571 RepID=UPI00378C0910